MILQRKNKLFGEFIPVKGEKKVFWGLKHRITKTIRPKLSCLLAIWFKPFFFLDKSWSIDSTILSCKNRLWNNRFILLVYVEWSQTYGKLYDYRGIWMDDFLLCVPFPIPSPLVYSRKPAAQGARSVLSRSTCHVIPMPWWPLTITSSFYDVS